ncbi:hypothetical protein M426DRAFT_14095 [Hypoxylon sp. CI-4A]|nr:hypothetical protein M426DRAFT_14095 [Hypoxylon sp. CI-4A]
MCWPYTIVYGCWDCMKERRPPYKSCVIVKPDAKDPVRGGYNHEGSFCPLRRLEPGSDGKPVTPNGCPNQRTAWNLPGPSTVIRTLTAIGAMHRANEDTVLPACPQYRFWICPEHLPKYKNLGPGHSGFDLASQQQKQKEVAAKEEKEKGNADTTEDASMGTAGWIYVEDDGTGCDDYDNL